MEVELTKISSPSKKEKKQKKKDQNEKIPQILDDLTDLEPLDNISIENLLKERYRNHLIYTKIGSHILISINPYESFEAEEKNKQNIEKFHLKSTEDIQFLVSKTEISPENNSPLFKSAELGFQELLLNRSNVSFVISGESGAGKTTTARYILEYISHVSLGSRTDFEDKILIGNDLLEAFGNAKTVKNDNSSRFGKLIQLIFDYSNAISGVHFTDYLLEKSRVTFVAPEEQNFHIFYHFVHSKKLMEKYKLSHGAKYALVPGYEKLDEKYHSKQMKKILRSFSILGLSENEIDDILRILAAIMLLGNLSFEFQISPKETLHVDSLQSENKEILLKLADLLQIPKDTLFLSLTTKIFKAGKGSVKTLFQTPTACEETKKTLCQNLYINLFAWLLKKINQYVGPAESKPLIASSLKSISILDIFGFENFALNSLEQLCINYANEKMQMFFTNKIFSVEKNIYEEEKVFEKVKIRKTTFTEKNNLKILELIEGNIGLFALLDDASKIQPHDDFKFVAKLISTHGKHENFVQKKKREKLSFCIQHFADEITYDATVSKLSEDIPRVFSSSLNGMVRNLLLFLTVRGTIVSQFKSQLSSLTQLLSSTTSFFIRCIKPNSQKIAGLIEHDLLVKQLGYLGIYATAQIRKEGFPIRMSFNEFVFKFVVLAKDRKKVMEIQDSKKRAKYLSKILKIPDFKPLFGVSKIFLKESDVFHLDRLRDQTLHKTRELIRSFVIGCYRRKQFLALREGGRTMSRVFKSLSPFLKFKETIEAATKLQALIKGHIARQVRNEMILKMLEPNSKSHKEKARTRSSTGNLGEAVRGSVKKPIDLQASDSPSHLQSTEKKKPHDCSTQNILESIQQVHDPSSFEQLRGLLVTSSLKSQWNLISEDSQPDRKTGHNAFTLRQIYDENLKETSGQSILNYASKDPHVIPNQFHYVYGEAIESFHPNSELDELSFEQGDQLQILAMDSRSWLKARLIRDPTKVGFIPSSLVSLHQAWRKVEYDEESGSSEEYEYNERNLIEENRGFLAKFSTDFTASLRFGFLLSESKENLEPKPRTFMKSSFFKASQRDPLPTNPPPPRNKLSVSQLNIPLPEENLKLEIEE